MSQHANFLNKARDQAYLQSNFLASLPPLQQRLAPELNAHGEAFLKQLNSSSSKPHRKQRKFDFGSGGDRRAEANGQ